MKKGWRKFKYSNDKISLNEWRRFFALQGLDVTFPNKSNIQVFERCFSFIFKDVFL